MPYTVCFAHVLLLDSGGNSSCIHCVQCPSVQNGEYTTVSHLVEVIETMQNAGRYEQNKNRCQRELH